MNILFVCAIGFSLLTIDAKCQQGNNNITYYNTPAYSNEQAKPNRSKAVTKDRKHKKNNWNSNNGTPFVPQQTQEFAQSSQSIDRNNKQMHNIQPYEESNMNNIQQHQFSNVKRHVKQREKDNKNKRSEFGTKTYKYNNLDKRPVYTEPNNI